MPLVWERVCFKQIKEDISSLKLRTLLTELPSSFSDLKFNFWENTDNWEKNDIDRISEKQYSSHLNKQETDEGTTENASPKGVPARTSPEWISFAGGCIFFAVVCSIKPGCQAFPLATQRTVLSGLRSTRATVACPGLLLAMPERTFSLSLASGSSWKWNNAFRSAGVL